MDGYFRWVWERLESERTRRLLLNENGVQPSEPVTLKPRRESLLERMWSIRGKHS